MIKNKCCGLYDTIMVEYDYLLHEGKDQEAALMYSLIDPKGVMPGAGPICMPAMVYLEPDQEIEIDEISNNPEDIDAYQERTYLGISLAEMEYATEAEYERSLNFRRIMYIDFGGPVCDTLGQGFEDYVASGWRQSTYIVQDWKDAKQSMYSYLTDVFWGTRVAFSVVMHPNFDMENPGGDHQYPNTDDDNYMFD